MGTVIKVIHLVTYSNMIINFKNIWPAFKLKDCRWKLEFSILKKWEELEEIDIKNKFDCKSFIGKGLLLPTVAREMP